MMRRVTAVLITLLVAFVGLFGLATPASAHTPSISATCEALSVNLTQYAAIQPGKPGTDAVPAVPEVKHTDKEFVQQTARYKYDKAKWDWYLLADRIDSNVGNQWHGTWKADGQTGWGERLTLNTPIKVNNTWYRYTGEQTKNENTGAAQWFHEGEYPGAPWVATGQTKVHVTQQYVAPVPAVPAVPEKANTVKVTIDGAVVADEKFGTSFSRAFNFSDKYTAHTYRVQVTAWDGSQYNLDRSGTSTPCSYPVVSAGKGVDCTTAWLYPGRALTNGDHINIEYVQNGQTKQVNAYVDRNVAGGYDTLGLRINGFAPIPLTQQQVQSGKIDFRYSDYIPAGYKVVTWVQFNNQYFNQDRNPANFLKCGDIPGAPVLPEPQVSEWKDVTVPTCDNFTITQERTVVTYTQPPFNAQTGVWPAPVANAPVTETQTRQATDEEIAALDCTVEPNPAAVITSKCLAEGGSEATVTLTNNADDKWFTDTLTASMVVYVNGDFREAVSVTEGETVVKTYSFAEDSGNHTIEVRTGPAFGDVLLDTYVVSTDCIPAPPATPEPTEWVDETFFCGDDVVTQTRTVYAAPVWNAETGVWEQDTTGTVETRQRPMTEDEIVSKCQPEPATEVFRDYAYNCDGTISLLVSTYSSEYIRVNGEWVLSDEYTVTTEFFTVSPEDVPEGVEIFPTWGCETPTEPEVPGTPVTPQTPSVAPSAPVQTGQADHAAQIDRVVAKAKAAGLAETGSDVGPLIGLSGMLILGGIAFLVIRRRRTNG